MSDLRQPAIRVTMMPRDTNHHGTIFGGVLLSYIDQAGAVAASLHTRRKLVTVAMREVVFHEPVKVGDLVSFYGEIARIGNTSVTVKVTVVAERLLEPGQVSIEVTEAEVVYVAVDDEGHPIPFSQGP
ncbi:MAG: acyl-CoA thioesterase [Vulcanimicrobiota bacterium]